ncbi:MAG: hypothetical protein U0414_36700 [Polyangiaceae bacterium]
MLLVLSGALFAMPALAQDQPEDHPSAEPSAAPPASETPPAGEPHPASSGEPSPEHPAEPPKTDGAATDHAGEPPPDSASMDAEFPPDPPDEGEAPFTEPPAYDEPPGADDYGIGPDGKIQDPNDPDAANYEVGEPTQDPAEGLGVDGKDYELPASEFEGIEGLDPKNLEALREITPAELGELDFGEGKGLTKGAEKQLDAQAHALEGILDPQAINKMAQRNLPVLRKKIQETKKKVHDKMVVKANAKLERRMNLIAMALAGTSLLSFLLLLMPLFLRKKYPGQGAKLFRISLYAALAMFGSFLLLSGVLVGMRIVQAKLGQLTNPGLVFSDGAFDAADKMVEDIAASPGLILKPLEDVATGRTDDLGLAILQNAAQFKKEVTVFKDVWNFYKSVNWVLTYVPTAMIVLAVLLFLLTIKDLIRDVVRVPERVMKGELKETEVFKFVAKRVKGETIATLCTLGVLTVLTIVSAIALSLLAAPTMANFIRQLFVTIQYTTVSKTFDKTIMYVGLLGVLVFIVLTVAISLVATILYLGKAQKIFRAWFNYDHPVAKYKGFFLGWRTLGVVWCLALPAIMLFSMSALANTLIDKATNGTSFDWSLALLPAAIALPGGLLLVWLVLFGLKTITSIIKYKVEGVPVSDAAIAQVAQAVGR